jgi:hypothetical protein
MDSEASEADEADVQTRASFDEALMAEMHKTGTLSHLAGHAMPCLAAKGAACHSCALITAFYAELLHADVDSSCKTRFVMELLTQLVAKVSCLHD